MDPKCKKRVVYWSLTVISNGNEKFVFCPVVSLRLICCSALGYCVMWAQHPVCCVVGIVCFHFYKLKDSISAVLKYLIFFWFEDTYFEKSFCYSNETFFYGAHHKIFKYRNSVYKLGKLFLFLCNYNTSLTETSERCILILIIIFNLVDFSNCIFLNF